MRSTSAVPSDHDPVGPANRWRVLAVVSAALLIVVTDITVLHIAIPQIAADLDPSATSLLWIVDIFPLVVAPLLVASGTLGDRFGRKRMLIIGLLVFCAASTLAAFAWTPAVLIAARAVQGVGGALIMPSTMSIIRVVFPDRQERIKAVGVWSAVLAGGAAAGPLLGGFLVEHFWWGAVFLINVPMLALVLPFAVRMLPESRHSDPPPWDVRSVALVTAGVLLLAFGIKHGARHGFLDPQALLALVGSVLSLATFARRQLTAARPLLELRLFARPAFSVAVGSVLLVMFALIGLELFFAQYLQLVIGLGPLDASIRLLPLALATLAGSLIAAPVLRRLGSRIVTAGGLAASAAALVPLLLLGSDDRYLLLAVPFAFLGLGLQMALIASNDTILSSVSADDAGQAAAIEETAYDLGGGLGVALLGAIGAAVFTDRIGSVPGVGAADLEAAGRSVTEATTVAERLPTEVGERLLAAGFDAFLAGFHIVLLVAIGLIAVSALVAAMLVPGRDHDPRIDSGSD